MELVRLTPENVYKYIGYEIQFNTPTYSDEPVVRKILRAFKTSVRIDYPPLKDNLEFITRKIYVINDNKLAF